MLCHLFKAQFQPPPPLEVYKDCKQDICFALHISKTLWSYPKWL